MDGWRRTVTKPTVAEIAGDGLTVKRNWAIENLSGRLFVERIDEDLWALMYEKELEMMNRDKVGAPHCVPASSYPVHIFA